MKERPIIFSGPMVRAILEERKLQTRRVMNPQPFLAEKQGAKWWLLDRSEDGYGKTNGAWKDGDQPFWAYCPYGKPGDRLWVRETWQIIDGYPDAGDCNQTDDIHFQYLADMRKRKKSVDRPFPWPCWIGPSGIKHGKKPAIHMPRWASRILLEITQVRVERVQEISYADCFAEGIAECDIPADDEGPNRIGYMIGPDDGKSGLDVKPQESFQKLWDSINNKRGFGWEANPWIWAISFKRVQP